MIAPVLSAWSKIFYISTFPLDTYARTEVTYQIRTRPVEDAPLGLHNLPLELVFVGILVELRVQDRLEARVGKIE
jgi:hypothetical protein